MSQQRRRFRQIHTFQEYLAEEAEQFRKAAEEAPVGMARELLLKRARQAEIACRMNEWIRSPGLRPPK